MIKKNVGAKVKIDSTEQNWKALLGTTGRKGIVIPIPITFFLNFFCAVNISNVVLKCYPIPVA